MPGRLDEAKKERDKLKSTISLAKDLLEAEKEKRAMVKDIIVYILGVLSSALTTILGYYFGSSKGSADKDNTLNVLAVKSQTLPALAQVAPADGAANRTRSTTPAAAG